MRRWLACIVGKREAILELASSPRAFGAGLLFLLSAGLAREYDGAFLPLEPLSLLIPFAVSAGMGAILWAAFFLRVRKQPGAVTLRSFLGVFWMSAPLAWLYGIPYERFLAPLDAFYANLWTLALVSLWRVAWVTRVIAVLRGSRTFSTLVRVLLIADVVVFVVAYLSPQPVLEFMGGQRGAPVEMEQGYTNANLECLAMFLFPFLALSGGIAALNRAGWVPPRVEASRPEAERELARFARCAVLVWIVLALPALPEQFRRWSVERDLRAGRIREALDAMSTRSPDDFPPHWDPPPHSMYEDERPPTGEVLSTMLQHPVADWVADRFVPKVFHGYYRDTDTYLKALFSRASWWTKNLGAEEARRRLEFMAAHAGELLPEQREAVDAVLTKVREGVGFEKLAELGY